MANFLEQLVSEWYEFNDYFVRRNVKVGKRAQGGFEGELDIVAFHPKKKHLIHTEPSMDAQNWQSREKRYSRKFYLGRKYIPKLFEAFDPLPKLDQLALIGFGSRRKHTKLGGGRLMLVGEFMEDVKQGLSERDIARSVVPEGFPLVRALQYGKLLGSFL